MWVWVNVEDDDDDDRNVDHFIIITMCFMFKAARAYSDRGCLCFLQNILTNYSTTMHFILFRVLV